MNPFYKTSYQRQPNISNFMQNIHDDRLRLKERTDITQKDRNIKKDIMKLIHENEKDQSNRTATLIEKKIEIDPVLLFSKNTKKHPQFNIPDHKKRNNNLSETKFYDTSTAFMSSKCRPSSKQEARVKIADKKCYEGYERPQTSKAQRRKTTKQEEKQLKNKTLGNEEEAETANE